MSETVYIALGSNLNRPKQQIETALKSLRLIPKTQFICHSSLYLSQPMGPQDQENYINAAAKLKTNLSPLELLDQLQAIENNQGRQRKAEQWGARTLDLDLLLYGQQIIKNDRLTVPHYGIKQRNFVVLPLAEIEPLLDLPDNSPISLLKQQVGNQGIQKL